MARLVRLNCMVASHRYFRKDPQPAYCGIPGSVSAEQQW